MTAIKPGSPVKRETASVYRGRQIIVELYPGYQTLRLKGMGRAYAFGLDYATAYEAAMKISALQNPPVKRKARRKH